MISIIIAAICGIVVGFALPRGENTCPAVELGYDCKGSRCDHRLSTLYKAKMDMALHDEEKANNNYWNGGK